MLINEAQFFSSEECEKIKQYAYEKEKKIRYDLKNVFHHFTEEKYNNSITTNNYNHYNFFGDHPHYADRLVSLLTQNDAPLEWPILVQSWINIYRKNDGIGWHTHYGSGLSSNIFTVLITGNACLAHEGQEIIFTPLFLKFNDFSISFPT